MNRFWHRTSTLVVALLAAGAMIAAGAGSPASADDAPAAPAPQVLVIGDSVAAGVPATGKLADLQARLPGWRITFDAKVNRTTTVATQLVSAAGPRRFQVVILSLGENDTSRSFADAMKTMLSVVATVPRVYWLTVHQSARYPWLPAINSTIRQIAPAYSNLAVADWNQYAAAHPADFYGDGLHLAPTGGADMAAFMADLVNDTSPYARRLAAPTIPPTTTPASGPAKATALAKATSPTLPHYAIAAHPARASAAPSARPTRALRVVVDTFLLLVLVGAAAIAVSPSCRRRRRVHRARLARINQRLSAAPSP